MVQENDLRNLKETLGLWLFKNNCFVTLIFIIVVANLYSDSARKKSETHNHKQSCIRVLLNKLCVLAAVVRISYMSITVEKFRRSYFILCIYYRCIHAQTHWYVKSINLRACSLLGLYQHCSSVYLSANQKL